MNNLIESIITSIQDNIALILIILGVLYITYTISLAIIFKKVGSKALPAFIPIYNIMTLLSILRIPKWMVLIMVIPVVNIFGFLFMSIVMGYKLGILCRKNTIMKIGLMFLSPVFYPLLAFTDIDVDGSKLDYVIEQPKKVEFKLDPVIVTDPSDAPEVMNLSDADNVDKITNKKVKPTVEIKNSELDNVSVEEHLAKANKEMPTAQDLTFDYNLIYNSKASKVEKVEEVPKEEKVVEIIPDEEPEKEEVVEETIVEEVVEEPEIVEEEEDDTPFVPVLHDVNLEAASPINETDIGPVPLNKRYENQMNANRQKLEKKKELELAKAKEMEDEISQQVEEVVIIDNGPINLNSSLAGLMASAPDFNPTPKPVSTPVEPKVEDLPKVVEPVVTPVQTTEVQEIVSMNIVEPSQLPVGIVPKEEKEVVKEIPNNELVAEIPQVVKPATPQFRGPVFITNNIEPQQPLLRPVGNSTPTSQPLDKECPQCLAKVRYDSPVCFMCGYKFIN